MAAIGGGSGDIEELLKQITNHPGVQGIIIVNTDGIPIRHTFQEHSRLLAVQYSALFQSLAMKARNAVLEIDNNNELLFLRVRTKKHEVLVAPDTKYLLIVIQQVESGDAVPNANGVNA
ncbi:dynein light chain 2B, cytoplasmic, putative [Trypanosoma brucei gambiense DAL972]|uniref:Dynein light chain roadblock n=2 Tax=Trypanosoma brucei TaxID=5691 RepID=C9ZZS8_TRYB9|nr:dynein light chain 2B, cytoplasmic, putative [Trypanosoma brucei gambiense DAL972]RHW69136.1 Dynein light chain roadblock-type protein [Trypanosoma brucei equiperdum]CBH16486.1 dynein light chain 2B, cytoplasmic, putative [Trypanosoma brucei gambiense DAL972]|eukprot:XP_011778750.1 dynein light chain 2B, cytoplasmic, putative [Trypanosoma brucei gambiense DAL972]